MDRSRLNWPRGYNSHSSGKTRGCEMYELLPWIWTLGMLWIAFSLSGLLRVIRAYHRDFRRVHGFKVKDDPEPRADGARIGAWKTAW